MFFGGGRRRGGDEGPPKGKDVIHQLPVRLEELYNGAKRKLNLTKNVICQSCSGSGGKNVKKCEKCNGTGRWVQMMRVMPGIVQQMQQPCPDCRGSGEFMAVKDRCQSCHGAKVVKENKILTVEIDKGMKDGKQIRFGEEGDQMPGMRAGDVIVVLDEQPHARFRRRNHDLIMEMEISLSESLNGFKRPIDTLDGRTLIVSRMAGEITKHGEVLCVVGEGMPIYRQPFEKGRLIISFNVRFPPANFLPAADLAKLEALLPPKTEVMQTDDSVDDGDERLIEPYTAEQRRRHGGQRMRFHPGMMADDDDDDDDGPMGGAQRVQCAQN